MKKSTESNTKKRVETRHVAAKKGMKQHWREYYNVREGRLIPYHPETLLQMAKDLVTEADNPSFVRLESFYQKIGVLRQQWFRWLPESEELRAAHDHAIDVIAVRRDAGALFKVYDHNTVFKTQAYYDPIYRVEQERAAKLKLEAEANQKNQKFTVELDIVEKTGVVKPLENK